MGGRLTFAKLPRRLATTFDLHSSVIRTLGKEVKSVVNSFHFLATAVSSSVFLSQRLLYIRKVCLTRTHWQKGKEKSLRVVIFFRTVAAVWGCLPFSVFLFYYFFFSYFRIREKKIVWRKTAVASYLLYDAKWSWKPHSIRKKSLMKSRISLSRDFDSPNELSLSMRSRFPLTSETTAKIVLPWILSISGTAENNSLVLFPKGFNCFSIIFHLLEFIDVIALVCVRLGSIVQTWNVPCVRWV